MDERKALTSMITKLEAEIYVLDLQNQYYTRRSLVDKRFEQVMGGIQAKLTESKDYKTFLEEKLKDLPEEIKIIEK